MTINIKEARQTLGLTQKQLADLVGMFPHRISELEHGTDGRKPTKQMLHHLAAIEVIADHGLLNELPMKIKATAKLSQHRAAELLITKR